MVKDASITLSLSHAFSLSLSISISLSISKTSIMETSVDRNLDKLVAMDGGKEIERRVWKGGEEEKRETNDGTMRTM